MNKNPHLRPGNLPQTHQVSCPVDSVTGREISLGFFFSMRAKYVFLGRLESNYSGCVANCPVDWPLQNLCWVFLGKTLRDASLISWSLTREHNSQPLGLSVGPERTLPVRQLVRWKHGVGSSRGRLSSPRMNGAQRPVAHPRPPSFSTGLRSWHQLPRRTPPRRTAGGPW